MGHGRWRVWGLFLPAVACFLHVLGPAWPKWPEWAMMGTHSTIGKSGIGLPWGQRPSNPVLLGTEMIVVIEFLRSWTCCCPVGGPFGPHSTGTQSNIKQQLGGKFWSSWMGYGTILDYVLCLKCSICLPFPYPSALDPVNVDTLWVILGHGIIHLGPLPAAWAMFFLTQKGSTHRN